MPLVVDGLTTQNPNLTVVDEVKVELKLEHTILVGYLSLALPGYTLQSIDEISLS